MLFGENWEGRRGGIENGVVDCNGMPEVVGTCEMVVEIGGDLVEGRVESVDCWRTQSDRGSWYQRPWMI